MTCPVISQYQVTNYNFFFLTADLLLDTLTMRAVMMAVLVHRFARKLEKSIIVPPVVTLMLQLFLLMPGMHLLDVPK